MAAKLKTLNGYAFNATELDGNPSSYYLPANGKAADSALLGGKPVEYFLPANAPRLQMNLIWENASPASTFAGQNINVSKYNYYAVISDAVDSNNITFVKLGGNASMMGFDSARSRRIVERVINMNSSGTIMVFSAAKYRETYASGSSEDNTKLIPYRIYGLNL